MAMKIFCENTPLTDNDCFVIFSREKSCFDFPLHTHKEPGAELGAQRGGGHLA